MILRIYGPAGTVPPASGFASADGAAILAYLAGRSVTTFDEVRAQLGRTAAQLPDGHIHQVALDAGYRVGL